MKVSLAIYWLRFIHGTPSNTLLSLASTLIPIDSEPQPSTQTLAILAERALPNVPDGYAPQEASVHQADQLSEAQAACRRTRFHG
jgi:hypothetical protein